MTEYEQAELAKLRLVIDAAMRNGDDTIRVCTRGNDPHASITIKAYVLAKLIKENK